MRIPTEQLSIENSAGPLLTVGVVTDTHVPDRVRKLHPAILPTLKAAGVQHIVHAGDICVPEVLEELGQVAPVTAARGNRDLLLNRLPLVEKIELGGVKLAIMHGHGGWVPYLWDKWQYLLFGYKLDRYLRVLIRASGDARVVIFGHTHHPETSWRDGKLLFNPGPAGVESTDPPAPSIGLLHIFDPQRIETELIRLSGYKIHKRYWVEN